MSMSPESSGPVLKLYAIELPDGSIAMSGPYVLATENEGQAGRMAHARDGQEIAFVRELQQAQVVGASVVTKEWLASRLAKADDSNCAAAMPRPSCLLCGQVGDAFVFKADDPDTYCCKACAAARFKTPLVDAVVDVVKKHAHPATPQSSAPCPECSARKARSDAVYRGPAHPDAERERLADRRLIAEESSAPVVGDDARDAKRYRTLRNQAWGVHEIEASEFDEETDALIARIESALTGRSS